MWSNRDRKTENQIENYLKIFYRAEYRKPQFTDVWIAISQLSEFLCNILIKHMLTDVSHPQH